MRKFWLKIKRKFFFWRKRRKTDAPQNFFSQLNKIEDHTVPVILKPKLVLERTFFTNRSTIGALSLDGVFECWILEDPVRKDKIPNITAIPEGTYEVVITQSPKFQRLLPLLKDVPNYEGIRIHSGNLPKHTSGCLLPGQVHGPDYVGLSRMAFDNLFWKLHHMLRNGKIHMRISNEREAFDFE